MDVRDQYKKYIGRLVYKTKKMARTLQMDFCKTIALACLF